MESKKKAYWRYDKISKNAFFMYSFPEYQILNCFFFVAKMKKIPMIIPGNLI